MILLKDLLSEHKWGNYDIELGKVYTARDFPAFKTPTQIEESNSDLISQMQKHFEYISKKYFKEDYNKYSKPKFKIKSNLKSVGVYIPRDNQFDINSDFASDEVSLKATMYHETIHYFQVHRNGFDKRKFNSDGYHDDFFKKMASKINSGEGSKLVTVSGTFQSIKSGKAVKSFWVYVVDKNDGDINWTWSPRKNDKMIERLDRMKDYYSWKSVKVFETDVIDFKEAPRATSGPKVKFGAVNSTEPLYKKINKVVKQHK